MVLVKKPGKPKPSTLGNLTLEFEPVHLPEAEDNERIKRLSRQILACIARARRERRRSTKQREDDPFRKDFDEIFGLKDIPV